MGLPPSLVNLVALPLALARLLQATDLPAFAGPAAFAGASASLLVTDEFPARLRALLLGPERGRPGNDRRSRRRARLLPMIRPLAIAAVLAPWIAAAGTLFALPVGLRPYVAGYLVIIALLAQLILRQVLEEVVVWGFIQTVAVGDFEAAMRLPMRAGRLAIEIERARPELEQPFAAYLAHGLNAPERFPWPREELVRLVKLIASARAAPAVPLPEKAGAPGDVTSPLVRRLLDRGIRLALGVEASALEEAGRALPALRDLTRPAGRRALAQLFPDEALPRVVLRRCEREVRGLLLPLGLLWIPLPVAAWLLRHTPLWPVPVALAALSLALLLWLVLAYSQWVFDESLRVGDLDFLADRLARGVMFGELEEALGARSAVVRDRAIELLLFHDAVVSQGITVPAPGLRKFLRAAP